MANDNLRLAKAEKNGEYYTQYEDIELELSARCFASTITRTKAEAEKYGRASLPSGN